MVFVEWSNAFTIKQFTGFIEASVNGQSCDLHSIGKIVGNINLYAGEAIE